MKLVDEQEECFESETGAPTLTVINSGNQRMIGYSSFCDALMENNRVTIRFRDWIVIVTGDSLEILWRQLQMQDVRLIRKIDAGIEHGCRITDIEIIEVEDP